MSNEQLIYDDINHNNIVIVGYKKGEPLTKKPKLDPTPEKEVTEKCDTKEIPDKATTPKKDANDDTKKVTCVNKEVKVHSWASSYLQSIGQQATPRMNLSLTNNKAVVQPNAHETQSNNALTNNWTLMNLPTRYLHPNPLSYHFQMQNSNSTPNAFCSAMPTNYNGPINYTSPINYTTGPLNYTAPLNYAAQSNYTAPQNYSAPIDYTASINYPTQTTDTAPIHYNAPLNYDAPLNNTATSIYTAPLTYTTPLSEPLNYTTPLTESITLITESNTPLRSPTTPLIDEPISPSSERGMPLNDLVIFTSLEYEPISPLSEPITPIKLDNIQKIDIAKERFPNDSIKIEKAISKTNTSAKSKIQLNLIKNKNDANTTSNSENLVYEQRDKYKMLWEEKIPNAHESKSLKTAQKRKFIESHKSVKEPSKADYSKKDRKKKRLSEHQRYHESESHKKKDKEGKHVKSDYNKVKIIEKMKEIRSLCEKAKGTSNKKGNVNKPSTSKNRKSRTPEPVQRNHPGPDSGNAEKDISTNINSLVKSVVQPIKKIKYPTINTKSHSPEQKNPKVPEHFDLRSKLSRANRYFHKNRYSKNNLNDCENLVVTINQQEMKTEPNPISPPKVAVTEKKVKSKTKKYKTIKFTIKVLCQDGEGSASSQSDDSEEEPNTREVASSPNDFSFLDDFNVDEIVDSLKNSQKRSVNLQNKNQCSHNKDTVSKNNKLNEANNDNETQVIQVNESNDCIIVEDSIETEIIEIEQKYDDNINESNDCVIIDNVELGKVKTDVYDTNNDSNDCVILNAASVINTKTEQNVINESNESCMILDDRLDIISIKSETNDDVDIKPNIIIKPESLENSNDCIVVEIENHPIKIEDTTDYIESDANKVMNNNEAQDIKMELDNIADKTVENINGSVHININENFNILHDEDTMEIPQFAEEPLYVENENMQGVGNSIPNNNCYPEHGEIEKTVSKINSNKATETVNDKIQQDLSIFLKLNNDVVNKVAEIPYIIKKEPTTDNIEIVDTIKNRDTNQYVHKTKDETKVIEEIGIPVNKEVSSIKKEPLIEIIPTQNVEINNEVSPEAKNANDKDILSIKSESSKKINEEKHEKVKNIEVASKSLEPVSLTKQNIDSAQNDETKKKREQIVYVCEAKGLPIEKAIKQEIINNIEPELAHLKPKDSQAIINAVAEKTEEIINTPKSETSNVKSKDTSKVLSPVATKTVETEKRQVVIVKKKEGQELGEIKEQLESRMFEYLHEHYTITSLIHEGKFSKIFKCNDSKNRHCVVKLLKSPKDRLSLGVEKENILQQIQRDIPKENLNIVMVIDGFGFERRWALLMDYYPNDLKSLLLKSKKGFSLDELPGLAKQLIMAIMVLRNNQIVHSDIRPSHILLDESRQRLKLCGFDTCYYANTITEVLPNIGKLSYRAPEIIMGFSASFSIDVWSAGTVLYEMFTRRKLFLGIFNNQVLFNQLMILGDMPADMIQGSPFQNNHFEGLSFVRRFGNGGMKRDIYHQFFKTQKLYNFLQSSYNLFWGMSNKTSRRDDLSKLYCFYELLEKMLVLDPRRRLPIEFVCADPFINELQ